MSIKYNYGLTGTKRKSLVQAISRILNSPAVYQGTPSFSYVIGDCMVDKNGVLSFKGGSDPEAARKLFESLKKEGFLAENMDASESDDNSSEGEDPDTVQSADVSNALSVEIPDTGFTAEARKNLKKIIANKQTLLKEALGTDTLTITEAEGKIIFPWFTLHGLDGEADAYSRLAAALCKMAKTQKRVTATEKQVTNAKYEMRLFLIRLGFVGDEYKTARKILLRNLTGNSSWKSGH